MTEAFKNAALMTRATLSILPLIAFCFIPVYQDIKSTPLRLLAKVAISFCAVEGAMFLIFLIIPSQLDTAANMLFCISVFFYLYQKELDLKPSHLWFVFMTACLIGSFSYLCYHIADIFLHPDSMSNVPHLDSLLIQIASGWAMVLLLFYPAKKYLGWLVHHFHEEHVWRLVWLLPAGFMLFSMGFIPYNNRLMYLGRFLQMYVITVPVLFILVFLIYVMFYQIAHALVERQNMLQKNTFLEIQVQQYHKLQAHVQETSRLRHDFRYQLTVLAEMLKNQSYEEMEQYLKQYISSVSETPVRYCASVAVNAVLNHYATVCKDLEITAHFSIRLQEQCFMEDIDFCVLLGNLLENAIDGCRYLPKARRQLTLKVLQSAERIIVLKISNPYQGSLLIREGKLFSSKHEGEGQGIKSAGQIAEKYHGFLEIKYDHQIFEAKVLLNL